MTRDVVREAAEAVVEAYRVFNNKKRNNMTAEVASGVRRAIRALRSALSQPAASGEAVLPYGSIPRVGEFYDPDPPAAPATEAKCGTCGSDDPKVRRVVGEATHGVDVGEVCFDRFHTTPRAGASEGEERPNWQQIAHDALWPDGALPLNGEKHIHKWALLLSAAYERGKADALRPTTPPAEVERARREFYEAARAEMDPANRPHNEHDHAAADRWSEAKKRKRAAYDAMLAAEAAERAERANEAGA